MFESFDPMVLTLLLPVLGALLVGTCGRQLGRFGSAVVASGAVGLSFLVVLSTIVRKAAGVPVLENQRLWTWMAGFPGVSKPISFGIYVDTLSLTLMAVVTGVGFLIHWYSSEYMEHDDEMPRFFTLLNVFIAAMTFLVLADNYATLIVGWGGVGFASFALIGFWREKPSAAAASKKAFVMNVVGDVGLMVAVFVLFKNAGTVDYHELFTSVLPGLAGKGSDNLWLLLVLLGLIVGAYAKSAQLPLHTWLPDAMEGPTPVSALIHAATMVTAGVYLLVRSGPLLDLMPAVGTGIAFMGALTALFAACCAMVQTDLKRVLAYSTMSQLGYMFMAVGVGAYGAAVFHLVTHAFFKALLFLTAGIVIHAAHGEQDMRKLGGLARQMPVATVLFAGGGLCLSGFPIITSGYYSKEAILHAAHHYSDGGLWLFLVGALVAMMTAFYTGRAFFLTFLGPQRVENPHLPGAPTTVACLILWCLSISAGWGYETFQNWLMLGQSEELKPHFDIVPDALGGPSLGLGVGVVLALIAAWALFGKGAPDRFGAELGAWNWLRSGMGFDGFYGGIAYCFNVMGRMEAQAAEPFFQQKVPGLLGRSFASLSTATSELQSGNTRAYLFSMGLFLVLLLFMITVFLGGSAQ